MVGMIRCGIEVRLWESWCLGCELLLDVGIYVWDFVCDWRVVGNSVVIGFILWYLKVFLFVI